MNKNIGIAREVGQGRLVSDGFETQKAITGIFGDDYITIVAETREQAEKLYDSEFGDVPEDGLYRVDGSKRKMLFPLDELPEQYHDKAKYPRKLCLGEYIGVSITLNEAMKFNKEKPPFHKPIHLYTKDELRNITMMYREVVASYGVDRITPKFIKASENAKDRRSFGGRPS